MCAGGIHVACIKLISFIMRQRNDPCQVCKAERFINDIFLFILVLVHYFFSLIPLLYVPWVTIVCPSALKDTCTRLSWSYFGTGGFNMSGGIQFPALLSTGNKIWQMVTKFPGKKFFPPSSCNLAKATALCKHWPKGLSFCFCPETHNSIRVSLSKTKRGRIWLL